MFCSKCWGFVDVPRLTDVDRLSVTGNRGLASVSFASLERANRLRIADNGFLTTLATELAAYRHTSKNKASAAVANQRRFVA